ncbi:rCG55983 [Rattus norvegicus]|uniref:RCG55983 n=1 Tax=Rattus norvegicus TaxID=10116 RepID=A6KSR4_RAT|nr:rCG55983 [Rattus norvegicus]
MPVPSCNGVCEDSSSHVSSHLCEDSSSDSSSHKVVVYQAMTTIKKGASPNIWLASLKDQEFALDHFCHCHVESLYPETGNFPQARTNLRHGARWRQGNSTTGKAEFG